VSDGIRPISDAIICILMILLSPVLAILFAGGIVIFGVKDLIGNAGKEEEVMAAVFSFNEREIQFKVDSLMSITEHMEKQIKALQEKSVQSRREHFAAMAMQGLLANSIMFSAEDTTERAVRHADALIEALESKPGSGE
jgi:hypothetical protein